MEVAANALLQLALQCGMHPQPQSCVLSGIYGGNTSAHIHSATVLHRVMQELLPTAIALEAEEQQRQRRGVSWRDGAPNGSDDVTKPILVNGKQMKSIPINDHTALMVECRGNPFFKMLLQEAVAHSSAHHGGGWTFAFISAKLLLRLLWTSSDVGNSRLRVQEELSYVTGWIDELVTAVDVRILIAAGWIRRAETSQNIDQVISDLLRLRGRISDEDERALCGTIFDCISLCSTDGGKRLNPGRLRIFCRTDSPKRLQEDLTATYDGSSTSSSRSLGPRLSTRVLLGVVLPLWQLSLENMLLLKRWRARNGKEERKHASYDETPRPSSSSSHDDAGGVIRVLLLSEVLVSADLPHLHCVLRWHGTHNHHDDLLLIASQRTIAPEIKAILYAEGALSLERLSARNMEAVSHVSGCKVVLSATMLPSLFPPPAAATKTTPGVVLGAIADITTTIHFDELLSSSSGHKCSSQLDGGYDDEEVYDQHQYQTVLVGIPNVAAIRTLMIYFDDPITAALVEVQVKHAFLGTCELFAKGALVVEGAGGWEQRMAEYVRARCVWSCQAATAAMTTTRPSRRRTLWTGAPSRFSSVVDEVPVVLSLVADRFRASSGDDDRRATICDSIALQVAAFVAKRRRSSCDAPPLCGSEGGGGRVWIGLPPLTTDEFLEHLHWFKKQQRTSNDDHDAPLWPHTDTWWCKRLAALNALRSVGTVLAVDHCEVEVTS